MRIGIVGTGNKGRWLGVRRAHGGQFMPGSRTRLVEAAADLVRPQILTMGARPLTTPSLCGVAMGSAPEDRS